MAKGRVRNTLFKELALHSFEVVIVLLLTSSSRLLVRVLLLIEPTTALSHVILFVAAESWLVVALAELLSVLINHH